MPLGRFRALPASGGGNGNGNGQTVRPPTPGFGGGGPGPGGSFNRTPPTPNQTLPGSGNYRPDEIRGHTPTQPAPRIPIQSNLLCGDCDTQSGGGGSTYHPTNDPNFSTANAYSFDFGTRTRDSEHRNIYFELNFHLPIGTDRTEGFSPTGYNTLILENDCITVVTSHPGRAWQ
jgi:hypothetical protein